MAKYLLLKHYRGAPAPVNDVPMDQWTPDEVEAHIRFMSDFAGRLESSGEFIDAQALSPEGVWVRYDGEGRPPVTDGPFAETKDLIAGWMVIDVDTYERAIELAAELSAAPGAGGEPIHEWLEVRPFLAEPPTVTSDRGRRGRRRAARARPPGPERPRPSRSGLRDGRGRGAGGAHPGAVRLGGRVARRPHGMADHGRLASVPRHGSVETPPAATERSGSTPSRRPARSRAPTTRCASTSCARTPISRRRRRWH